MKAEDLPMCEIWWIDAHGGPVPQGWGALGLSHSAPTNVRTVGLLMKYDSKGATVCLSALDSGESDAYIFIPDECIKNIWVLKP